MNAADVRCRPLPYDAQHRSHDDVAQPRLHRRGGERAGRSAADDTRRVVGGRRSRRPRRAGVTAGRCVGGGGGGGRQVNGEKSPESDASLAEREDLL